MTQIKAYLTAIALLTSLCTFAEGTVGKVTANTSTKKGATRTITVADAIVTDGINVTTTNKDGSFQLPSSSSRYLFAASPSGNASSNTSNKEGIESGNALHVTKTATSKGGFTNFIIINNPRPSTATWVANIKQQCQHNGSSFALAVNCNNDTTRQWLAQELGLPVHTAFEKGTTAQEMPFNYSFYVGSIHFIVVSESMLNEAPLKWLRQMVIAAGRTTPTVIVNNAGLSHNRRGMLTLNSDTLQLDDFNVKAIIDAKSNVTLYDYRGKLTPTSICSTTPDRGGDDYTPASFRSVSISPKGEVETEAIPTSISFTASLVSPSDTAYVDDNKLRFYVNAFSSGSAIAKVKVGISADSISYKWNELINVSPWTWSGFYVMAPSDTAQFYHLKLEAFTKDGQSYIEYKRTTLAYKRDTSYKFAAVWNRGIAADTANNPPLKAFSGKISHLWTISPQGSTLYSSPKVADSIVVATLSNDMAFNKSEIVAVNINTGKTLWHYFPLGSIKNSFVLHNDKVIASDFIGNTYCIEARTGSPIWKDSTKTNDEPYTFGGGTTSDTTYICSTNHLSAYSIGSGKRLWDGRTIGAAPNMQATPTVGNGIVITLLNNGNIAGIDCSNGQVRWISKSPNLNELTACFANGNFFALSKNRYFVIRTDDGTILATGSLPAEATVKSTPIVNDNLLVYGTIDKGLIAYDIQKNELKWSVDVGVALVNILPHSNSHLKTVASSPVQINSYTIFGGADGYLYIVSTLDGTVKQKVNLGAPILSTPTIYKSRLVVSDLSGNITAFRML